MVTEGSCPEWLMVWGPASFLVRAKVARGTRSPVHGFEVQQRQIVLVLLELRQHLEKHAVLIGGTVNRGRPLRTKRIIHRIFDLQTVQVKRSGLVTV